MSLDSTTAITISGVRCWDRGTEEHFERLGYSHAIRSVLCAWGDRLTLVNALRGGAGVASGVYYYNLAAGYPDATFLAFDSVTISGVAGETGLGVGPNGQVAYKYARLAIKYQTLDYLEGTATGTLSLDYSTEVIAARKPRRLSFGRMAVMSIRPIVRPSAWRWSAWCRRGRIWRRCRQRWCRVYRVVSTAWFFWAGPLARCCLTAPTPPAGPRHRGRELGYDLQVSLSPHRLELLFARRRWIRGGKRQRNREILHRMHRRIWVNSYYKHFP